MGARLADQVKPLDWRHRNVQFLAPLDFVNGVARRVAALIEVALM